MKRIQLTDGSNAWFDADRAAKYEEDKDWDGNNWISKATGSQWDHEVLYRTASGKYILNSWSNWESVLDRWEEISEARAHEWLIANDYPDAVPPEVDEAHNLDSQKGETPRRTVRIPDDLWSKAQGGGSASALIVELLTKHFA